MNSPNPYSSPSPQKAAGTSEKKDAVELLKADHRAVEQLFGQFASAKSGQQRKKLVEKIAVALTAHTLIEEEIFYPACRDKGVEHDALNEAQVEHDTVKLLVADLLKGSQDGEYYEAKVTVLSEYVKHHVGEEEDPSNGIFAHAKSAGLDMDELGQKLQTRKDELLADEKRLLGLPPHFRSLDLFQQTQAYGDLSRYPDRHRDEDQHRNDSGRYGGDRSLSGYRGDIGDSYRETRGGGSPAYRGDYDRSARGYPDEHNQPRRGLEVSGGGGRHRPHYDDDYSRPSSGRHIGSGSEDHEYYQGTRYGSAYGGGRYRTDHAHDDEQARRDRYYNSGNGQGYSMHRDDDHGDPRGAYGDRGDYRGDQGNGGGHRDDRDYRARDENFRPGSGFRGVR
jgi:hemerythrin superfamily protein